MRHETECKSGVASSMARPAPPDIRPPEFRPLSDRGPPDAGGRGLKRHWNCIEWQILGKADAEKTAPATCPGLMLVRNFTKVDVKIVLLSLHTMSSTRMTQVSSGRVSRQASSRSAAVHDDEDDSPPTESIHSQSRSTSAAYTRSASTSRHRSESSSSTVHEQGQGRTSGDKGKQRDAGERPNEGNERNGRDERKEREEHEVDVRRRFGLPAVKGTIGAIGESRCPDIYMRRACSYICGGLTR